MAAQKVHKGISMLLIISLFFSVFGLAPIRAEAAVQSENKIISQKIQVFSSVLGETHIYIYKYNNEILISVDDAAKLTKCSFEVNDSTATLVHGARIVQIDADRSKLIEKDFSIEEDICAISVQETILVDAYAVLVYMGATLDVRYKVDGEPVLICNMPKTTFWEAIATVNYNTYFDAEEVYGGKTSLCISLACDIFTDIVFGHGLFVSNEDYVEEALYEILNVSFTDNSIISELLEDANKTTADLYEKSSDLASDLLGFMADTEIENMEEAYETLSNLFVLDVKKNIYNVNHATVENVAYYRQQLHNSVNSCSALEDMEDYLLSDSASANLDIFSDLIESFSFMNNYMNTCESLYSLNASHVDLMNETLGEEALARRGYSIEDAEWLVTAQKVLQTAQSSNSQKAIQTLVDQTITQFQKDVGEKGVEKIAEAFLSKSSGAFSLAFSLSKVITYFVMYDTINAYSADLKALYISDIQNSAMTLAQDAAKDMLAEHGANADTIRDLNDIMRYYCLASIALYDNLAISVKEFGSNEKETLNTIDALKESLTESYFYLSICSIDVIPNIDNLVDNVFSNFIFEDESIDTVTLVNDNVDRDIVLVLDTSGSMYGEPIEETVDAASKFVQQTIGGNTEVGLVTFNSWAEVKSDFTNNASSLIDLISGASDEVWEDRRTNTYDALLNADQLLQQSTAEKKIIVLMTDGLPNESPNLVSYWEPYSSYKNELINFSDELKEKGYYIYTLGFFQNLDYSDLSEARSLLDAIASEGYYYDVDDAESISFFFNDIASAISGTNSILIKIACPVDVTVTYAGETLSSNEDSRNTRTSFGSLSFMGYEDEQKILRLQEGRDYDISIIGTGEGTMNYTISFPDENGDYSDVRTFENIPITPDTVINTNTQSARRTSLKVDTDGNGRVDLKYNASANSLGELAPDYSWVYVTLFVVIIVSIAALLLLKFVGVDKIRKIFYTNAQNQQSVVDSYCTYCGAKLLSDGAYCPECGKKNIDSSSPVYVHEKKYCEYCGQLASTSDPFCENCGHRL